MRGRLLMVVLIGLTAAGGLRAGDRAAVSISPFAVSAPRLPVEALPDGMREKVQTVLEKPTLSSRSIPETFNTDHTTYRYLLENPDHAVRLWKQLGAKVTEMEHRGNGLYVWQDGQGSEVTWQVIHRGPGLHVWYAEGKVKPTLLLAAQPFKAVAMMQYTEGLDVQGLPAVRHQVHFHLRCEGRAITLAARVLGASAPHLAEQYLGQLQMFYGGLAWYLYQDPGRAKKLYSEAGLSEPVTASK
jgi:hypothetical protein